MITLGQYFAGKFNHPDATEVRKANARDLLEKVNPLLNWIIEQDVEVIDDPDTDSQISGSPNGAGDGGFRLQTSTTGAPHSKHKEGLAVDVYDPRNAIEAKINDEVLERFKLYREHPDSTRGWVHLQSVPPGSNRRTFRP